MARKPQLAAATGRPWRVWERRCALGMLVCLAGFIGFLAAAMAVYPGGNWLDRSAAGHRFFANFLCDLTQPTSLSGVNNALGAALAQIGMLFFALSLAGFFGLMPAHFAVGSRAARWVRGLGVAAVLCFIAVPLTPSERFGRVHSTLALTAGCLGIAAALWGLRALAAAQRRTLVLLGALSLGTGALEAVLFAYHLGDETPPPLLIPAIQKVAAVLLSTWIVAVATGVLLEVRGSRHDVGTPPSSTPPPNVP